MEEDIELVDIEDALEYIETHIDMEEDYYDKYEDGMELDFE